MSPSFPEPRPIPGNRWSLWMADDGTLRANRITPAWGGGGLVVVPEGPTPITDEMVERAAKAQIMYLIGQPIEPDEIDLRAARIGLEAALNGGPS